MKLISLFFTLLVFNLSFAQNPRVNPNPNSIFENCDLGKKNENWWKELTLEFDTVKRIELIKRKIISDTLYKEYNPKIKTVSSPSISIYNTDQNGNLCDVKILFVVNYHKKKNTIVDLLKHPNYIDFLNKITSKNTDIRLIPALGGVAIYGERGSAGVVYMTITDKTLKREIKKLLKVEKPNG